MWIQVRPPPSPQSSYPASIGFMDIHIHLLDCYLILWIANLLLTYRPLAYGGQLVCSSVKVVAGSQGKGAAHTQNKMAALSGITLQPTWKNTAGMQLTSGQ